MYIKKSLLNVRIGKLQDQGGINARVWSLTISLGSS